MHVLPAGCLTILAMLASTPREAASNVLRVGAGQAFSTIAAAIAAAVDGDVVLVDPASYGPFRVIDKDLTVASSGGAASPFFVQQTPGQPAVAVHNLAATRTVALLHIRTAFSDGGAPAVELRNCLGPVHCADLVVDLPTDLTGAVARAAVEVTDCASAWFVSLQVAGALGRSGNTTSVHGAPIAGNAGLCAVLAENSAVTLHGSHLRAFDNPGTAGGTAWGGDALRLIGTSSGWLISTTAPGLLRAGHGATYGGSAVHQVQPVAANFLQICGTTTLVRGTGSNSANRGGLLAVDGDRGLIQSGPMTIERFPPACVLETVGAVSLPDPRLVPGSTTPLAVASFFPRVYFVAMAMTTRFLAGPSFTRQVIDPQAGPTAVLGFGVLSPAGGATLAVGVPAAAALIGLHLTFQGAMGPPLGQSAPDLSLTLPAFAVVTP